MDCSNYFSTQLELQCDGLPKLYPCMFSDSAMAKIFTIWQNKCVNYVKFGIPPYLKDLCQSELKAAPFCPTNYGESLNRIF